jgi:hypothetical protein
MNFKRIYESEEQDKKYAKYAKLVYEKFYNKENDRWGWGGISQIKDFPEHLDTENCDIIDITSEGIQFLTGGDWQSSIPVTLWIDHSEKELQIIPFTPYDKKEKGKIKLKLDELKKLATEN